MDKLFFVLLLTVGVFWLYDESIDSDKIDSLEKEIAAAEARVKELERDLGISKSEYMKAVEAVDAANIAINSILDNAGKNIDEGLNGIQKLRAINQSYDDAVTTVRDKCAIKVTGGG